LKRILTLIVLTGMVVAGGDTSAGSSRKDPSENHPSVDRSSDLTNRDDLLGWYNLANKALIPVFKSDGTYYSVCEGWEVPLKPCPEGLELHMLTTTIGFDKKAKTHFIRILDPRTGHYPEGTIPPEKRPMTKVARPSWFRGPKAQPPTEHPGTNDDFLGWYQYVWWPHVRLEIRKDGQKRMARELL